MMGVVVVERERLASLIPLAHAKVADEAARLEAIGRGDTAASWLEKALRNAGALEEGKSLRDSTT
jgi:hypothetical protein